jgi:hypothetical protein
MSIPLLPGYTPLKENDVVFTEAPKEDAMEVSLRLKGHLDPTWQEWLEGLQIVHESEGTSRLSGTLPDQSALYGVLTKLSHLSLTLLSLESSDPTHNEGS